MPAAPRPRPAAPIRTAFLATAAALSLAIPAAPAAAQGLVQGGVQGGNGAVPVSASIRAPARPPLLLASARPGAASAADPQARRLLRLRVMGAAR